MSEREGMPKSANLDPTISRRDSFAASIRYEIIAPRNFHGFSPASVVTVEQRQLEAYGMNCAYYQQHGGPYPVNHNVNNNYFNEVN